MAKGIPFDQANMVLTAPTPEDAAAGGVYDLHVHRYTDRDGRPNVLSKWALSPEELAEVNRTGGVLWFHCWGHTHPPVSVGGHDPFRGAAADETRDRGASYVIAADRDPGATQPPLG